MTSSYPLSSVCSCSLMPSYRATFWVTFQSPPAHFPNFPDSKFQQESREMVSPLFHPDIPAVGLQQTYGQAILGSYVSHQSIQVLLDMGVIGSVGSKRGGSQASSWHRGHKNGWPWHSKLPLSARTQSRHGICDGNCFQPWGTLFSLQFGNNLEVKILPFIFLLKFF